MESVKKASPGEVLFFQPEELTMLVVMASDEGVRYIEPMNLKFDDNGDIKTNYASYETLSEWTISFGTMADVSAKLVGKSK
jgi:hypothetical protein